MRIYNRNIRRRFATFVAPCLLASIVLVPTPTPALAAITIASDPILYWNDVALNISPVAGAPAQTRAYAMVNIAMYDAVNATLGSPNRSYLMGVTSFGGDTSAAAAQAAHDVLVNLNPTLAPQYDAALDAALALIPDSPAKSNGRATGAAYAAAIRDNRTGDGSAASVAYTTTGKLGDWRPTSAGNPVAPQWGDVKTFVLSSGDAVRAGPPPALESSEYAAAYNEVKDVVNALKGPSLTLEQQDQKNSALFWDNAAGGPWIRIGLLVAEDEGKSTLELASSFALLSTGLADAIIAGFDSKYEYRLWRPQTAIQLGDTDDNAATIGDTSWTSLFAAPLHPSYISTHSALSGAGSSILSALFGDDEGFTFTIATDTRSFTGLEQAALDGANSRLWGGIHFRFDNDAGLAMGREIGARALADGAFKAVPEPSTWAMMIAGFGLIGATMRRRSALLAVAA